MLEAGSDVFPDDPRPVVFAHDMRMRDGEIQAVVTRPGDGPGVVVRHTGHRTYYAAVETARPRLVLLRRPAGRDRGSGHGSRRGGPPCHTLQLRTGVSPLRCPR